MKSIILLTKALLFLFFLSCSENSSDTNSEENSYQASWDANAEPDLSHYDLFIWRGLDSTESPFVAGASTSLYSDYFVKSVTGTSTSFLETADDKSYIQAALSAVDLSGNKSVIAVSNIIKAADSTALGKSNNEIVLEIKSQNGLKQH